jgi:uncharacterized protein YndB with AHSA1/START domain
MAEAELARFVDRFTMEYVRVYPHPIERVWRAITDPNEFRAWFIPGALELKTGGDYRFGAEGSTDFAGQVLAVDPPTLLRFSHSSDPEAYFQYELTELAGATRMRFVQHFAPGLFEETPDDLGGDLPGGPGTPWKPGFVGGWHEFWDALRDYLDGVTTGSRLPPTEFGAIAESFAREMVRSGRMTEVNAKRLVLGLRRQERWNELNKIYRDYIKATIPPA